MNCLLEVTKILVERMRVETQELSRRMTSKKWYSSNSQFTSIVYLFESENDFKKCNLFPKDYNKYNEIRRLI
jgi:hypothetical protein